MTADLPTPARAVLFDLDGVLVDSERLHYRAYSEVLAEFDVVVSPEVYSYRFIELGTGHVWATEEFGLPIAADEVKARKTTILHRLFDAEIELMPHAREAVEHLAASYPLAVATNSGRQTLDIVLDRFGLRDHFQALCPRETYDGGKPLPDAYLAAAAALDTPPAECVAVEDSGKGARAALAAGCRLVVVPHQLTESHDFTGAHARLRDLSELRADQLPTVFGTTETRGGR